MTNLGCLSLIMLGMFYPPLFLFIIILLAIICPINIFATINLIIAQTSILNRGRYLTLTGFFLVFVISPLLALIYLELNTPLILSGIMIGLTLIILLLELRLPLLYEFLFSKHNRTEKSLPDQKFQPQLGDSISNEQNASKEVTVSSEDIFSRMLFFLPNLTRNWIRAINQSGFVPYIVINMVLYFTMGFLVVILPSTFQIPVNYFWLAMVVFIVLILSGIIIDFYGRKPALVIIVFLLGLYVIFFNSAYPFWYQRVVVYTSPFIFVAMIMFSACIIGDFSSTYRRGRALSIITFFSMFSLFLGIWVGTGNQIILEDLAQSEIGPANLISGMINILSILILLCMMMLIFTPEPFDRDAITWRDHLERLYILSKDGLNLYYHKFEKKMKLDLTLFDTPEPGANPDLDQDLVSSGLTGIQTLLKEIAQTSSNLRVLDHSDRKIYFSHGKYTTVILISSQYLTFYHELLQRFQNEFEFCNASLLESFKGVIPNWNFMEELGKKYFDIQPQLL